MSADNQKKQEKLPSMQMVMTVYDIGNAVKKLFSWIFSSQFLVAPLS